MTCSKLVVHRKHFCANQSYLIFCFFSQEPGPPNAPAQNPCVIIVYASLIGSSLILIQVYFAKIRLILMQDVT